MYQQQPFSSALQVFSSMGGLALLARHLPTVYPEAVRPPPKEKSTSEQSDSEWIKVEGKASICLFRAGLLTVLCRLRRHLRRRRGNGRHQFTVEVIGTHLQRPSSLSHRLRVVLETARLRRGPLEGHEEGALPVETGVGRDRRWRR
jgi:hypothetical protein